MQFGMVRTCRDERFSGRAIGLEPSPGRILVGCLGRSERRRPTTINNS